MDDRAARERVARVEGLLAELEALPDERARHAATELVEALLELYGEGLARIVGVLGGADRAALAEDELVGHLMLLHDLYPVPVEERVGGALDAVRPYLESHGGDVELLGVEDGVVRLRLEGSCSGCPSSAATLELAVEEAIRKAAPDVLGVEAEGAAQPGPGVGAEGATPPGPGALRLELSDALRERSSWTSAGRLDDLEAGGTAVREVAGGRLLFLRLEDALYAYRPVCPACGGSLAAATLRGAELGCACGQHYDVRRAGRSLDAPRLQLEPVPLLVSEAGAVEVAA